MSNTSRTKDTNEIITGYKAFDPDFKCQDYQYEVGKTFEHNGKIQMCYKGFHFCYNDPIDVFNYYPLVGENGALLARFAKVSAAREGSVVDCADLKCVTSKISIDKEITLDELLKEQVDKAYKSKGETELLIATEDGAPLTDKGPLTKIISNRKETHIALAWSNSTALASADCAYLASSSPGTRLYTMGENASVSSSGYGSKIYSNGHHSSTSASGAKAQFRITGNSVNVSSSGSSSRLNVKSNFSEIASSGKHSVLNVAGSSPSISTSGCWSELTVKGGFSEIASSGDFSKLRITGKNASVSASGYCSELTVTGKKARMAVVGNYSQVTYEGKDGVISILGIGAKFKGSEGTLVLAVTYNRHGKPRGGLVGRIGENGLKPDTLYTVADDKFVEVEAENE